MTNRFLSAAAFAAALLTSAGANAAALTVDEFLKELVGVPLCGVPQTGPLAGRSLCTIHSNDGTAVVTGSGFVLRGVWEADGERVCRRNQDDPLERRHCISYERTGPGRYRNTDGVDVCIGPCP